MWIKKYTSEVVREGKRVRWPKSSDFWKTFLVVVIISVVSALFIYLEDTASYSLLEALENAFEGFGA